VKLFRGSRLCVNKAGEAFYIDRDLKVVLSTIVARGVMVSNDGSKHNGTTLFAESEEEL
jgi:hypothetical protein